MTFFSKFLFQKLLKSYSGITLFPFIILKYKENDVPENAYKSLLNHEKIHFVQQAETLVVFFYILYAAFYLRNIFKGMRHFQAYQNIPFEKESYEFENDLEYLKHRKFFSWRKFI
jgi:hypothetical protein